jgi:NAD(P)-dependent dehydrogenase (short-subunit alcohol dehydrogenase family)
MTPSLSERAALITGGASGIGRAVVRRFLADGARVAILDRSEAALADCAREFGDDVLGIAGDVTKYADNARAVAATVARFGKLDTLIGNAGVFDNYATLESLAPEQLDAAFDEIFAIDVKGYLFAARAALDALRAQAGSAIVFTASVSGLAPAYGGVLYIPAKHAVVGLTKRLALELAPAIRVNAVAPGFVPTALGGLAALGQQPKDPSKRPSPERFPLREVPEVEHYASLFAFLASPQARQMTGQTLLADGGLTLQRA